MDSNNITCSAVEQTNISSNTSYMNIYHKYKVTISLIIIVISIYFIYIYIKKRYMIVKIDNNNKQNSKNNLSTKS